MNDKKVDGELYAYLQSLAKREDGITYINKWDMPAQKVICGILGIVSDKTYRAHLKYLINNGYVIDDTGHCRYILQNIESIYLMLPLDTLRMLNRCLTEYVIKIYIYLGQRWKASNKLGFDFTYLEIGEHIGISVKNYSHDCAIRDALIVLSNCELIKVSKEFFTDDKKSRRRLIEWSDECKTPEEFQ